MSSTLLRVAGEHNSVVAVVGKGHLPGIKKNWKQPIEVIKVVGSVVRLNLCFLLYIAKHLEAKICGFPGRIFKVYRLNLNLVLIY